MTYNTPIHPHYFKNPTPHTRKHIEHTYKIVPFASEKKLNSLCRDSSNGMKVMSAVDGPYSHITGSVNILNSVELPTLNCIYSCFFCQGDQMVHVHAYRS